MLPKVGRALQSTKGFVASEHLAGGRVEHALFLEICTLGSVSTLITQSRRSKKKSASGKQ